MNAQDTTFKPKIRRLGPTRFLVESKTRLGTGHQVDTLRLRCGSEAGQHGRRCWHLVWALQAEAYYKRVEEAAQRAKAQVTSAVRRPVGRVALMEAFA